MESDKKHHSSNWRTYPHLAVNLSYWPLVLYIVDLEQGIVLINDHHDPDANIIQIRQ